MKFAGVTLNSVFSPLNLSLWADQQPEIPHEFLTFSLSKSADDAMKDLMSAECGFEFDIHRSFNLFLLLSHLMSLEQMIMQR
jgi:hypothetical protein